EKWMRSGRGVWPGSDVIWAVEPSEVDAVQPLSCSKSSSVVCALTESLPTTAPSSTSESPSLRRAGAVSSIRACASSPRPPEVLSRTLVLQRPTHDPRDVVSLQGYEQPQNRQYRQHRPGHHQLGILHVLAEQVGERDRQRVEVVVGEHDQRPEKVVPRA